MSGPKHHQVWQRGSRLDMLHTLPALSLLASTLPSDQRIVVSGTAANADVFELALKRGLAPQQSMFLPEVASGAQIDTAYCLDRQWRSGWRAWRSGAAHRVGFSSGAASYFYNQHVMYQWNEGYLALDRGLDLFRARHPNQRWEWDPKTAPSLLRDPVVGRSPDPVVVLEWDSRWPVEAAALFCRELCARGIEVWLVGTHDAHVSELQRAVPSLLFKDRRHEAGQSLSSQVSILSQAWVIVTPQLFTAHLACDINVTVVALLGPTLGDLGYAPWRRTASLISVAGAACSACERAALGGRGWARRAEHICLAKLSGERVLREVVYYCS